MSYEAVYGPAHFPDYTFVDMEKKRRCTVLVLICGDE
jgi:hypothetical protein